MKFSNVKEFLSKAAKKLTSPKTVAALGVAVALFQLCLAVDELRGSTSDREDDE